MVRTIAGTLMAIARNELTADDLREAIVKPTPPSVRHHCSRKWSNTAFSAVLIALTVICSGNSIRESPQHRQLTSRYQVVLNVHVSNMNRLTSKASS